MTIIQKAKIKCGNKYLVLKHAGIREHLKDLWDLPGGALEMGDDPAQSLIKEVEKETGLKLHVMKHSATIEQVIEGRNYNYIAYEASILEGAEVKLSDKYTEYRWLDKQGLIELPLNELLLKFF
jgi:ADP-ribose pyrophosphatase YjhB (NUDIX family)